MEMKGKDSRGKIKLTKKQSKIDGFSGFFSSTRLKRLPQTRSSNYSKMVSATLMNPTIFHSAAT